MNNTLHKYFLLDPNVTFLNHGSFGACPKPVFEAYQHWQREMERQPVKFLAREHDQLLNIARRGLAEYLHTAPENLLFVTNATMGMNHVARSLDLGPGDVILSTDHEYNAVNKMWQFICSKTGAQLVNLPIPVPVTTHADFVERFWAAVTPQTKVISISHITSPTALTFPVAEICRRAREAGILTVVDGAHAPGQIPLDMHAIDADFYTGNCHKWLSAPKSVAFLYARPDRQALLEPFIVSHGWNEPDMNFIQQYQWSGTQDIAAILSVNNAIEFQQQHEWDTVRLEAHELARKTREQLAELFQTAPLSPDAPEWFTQMVAVELPPCDVEAIKQRLYDEYRIEAPVYLWNDRPLIRLSYQGYNSYEDLYLLLQAMRALFN